MQVTNKWMFLPNVFLRRTFFFNIQYQNKEISQNMHNHALHVQMCNTAQNMQIL
jgi:hypothetical protein